jgi:2-polyprenyl-3-methyl-5-hydroxy-6-metoxy-1,4-benzoquinol methylase
MRNMRITSPVTQNYNVEFEEELSIESIISNYRKDYDIDVNEYFKQLDSVKIYRCLDTGYRFYFPFNIAGHGNLYEKLQNQPWYYSIRWEHQLAEKLFHSNDSVLEIGCGRGDFLENLSQKGISCTGLELNEDAVSLAHKKGLNVVKQDICIHAKEYYANYDIVCYFQVLEHIPQVYDFIQASIDALKVGGKLIIGVPNNNPFLYKYDKYHTLNLPPHHMGLWNVESLSNLQNFFNIHLEKIWVEPLQKYDYEHYFRNQTQYLKSRSKLLGNIFEFPLLSIDHSRVRGKLQGLIGRLVQGRNIVAVYNKV